MSKSKQVKMTLPEYVKKHNVEIICTSMKNEKKRRAQFVKVMKNLGLKDHYKFMDATNRDVKNWAKALKEVFGHSARRYKDYVNYLVPKFHLAATGRITDPVVKSKRGVIGDSLTKARALHEAVRDNKIIMITEDDMCISKTYKDADFSKLNKVNWDLMYLGHCFTDYNKQKYKLDGVHKIAHLQGTLCCHAVMIKPETAKILLKHWLPMRESDDQIKYIGRGTKMNVYGLQPPIFYQDIKFESALRDRTELEKERDSGKFGDCGIKP